MGVVTVEGIVEHGQIRLPENLKLPDNTKVYVVVPDLEIEHVAHLTSPRLVRPEDAADFVLEVSESEPNAGL